ncbi:MAG: acyl-CoA thioesterase [Solimicrobium sp.]|jgi:acyl-CoA thioester hydrolase|nr:acyl-CoA thioesterase [Solimicrobium sp.]
MTKTEQPQRSFTRLVKTIRMPVRWGDMDAFNHVNNTVYFRYMEQIRMEWLVSFFDTAKDPDTGPVLINAQCSFLRPIKYPDQIEVHMHIASPGRSSFETYYQIYRVDGETILCAEGSGKIVWVDRRTEKSIPLPEVVIRQFETSAQP